MEQVSLRRSEHWQRLERHPIEDEPVGVLSKVLPPIWRAFRSLQVKDVATVILGTSAVVMRVLTKLSHYAKPGESRFLFGFP